MVGTTRGGTGHLGLTHAETHGDRVWTACGQRRVDSKRPQQQQAQPQYANYWAPLTHKRHILPHPAQPRHTDHWAPRTRKRHQHKHRPQRPTERSDPTQHAKGRTGDCPGPRKGATTRRNVTQGVSGPKKVPKIRRKIPAPLIHFIFCVRKILGGWAGRPGLAPNAPSPRGSLGNGLVRTVVHKVRLVCARCIPPPPPTALHRLSLRCIIADFLVRLAISLALSVCISSIYTTPAVAVLWVLQAS